MEMFKHLTSIVFWSALFLSIISSGVAYVLQDSIWLLLLGASLLYNLWAVFTSDRTGFIREKEMRRAYEPPRHFNPLQIFITLGMVMVQLGVAAYILITANAPWLVN